MQNHVFQIEKLRKLTLYGVLLILTLIIALILLLQTTYIQTGITKFVTKEISKKLNSEINIGNVKISLFKGFVFKNVYIQDIKEDTLFYAKEISLIPNGLQINYNNLSVKELRIDSVYFNLYETSKDTLNIDYLIDALHLDDKTDSENDFSFFSQKVSITNSNFSYKESDTIKKKYVNFKDLKFDSINISFNNLKIENDKIFSEVENISFNEKSGFKLTSLSTKKLFISPKQIHLSNFSILTPNSKLVFDSLNTDFPERYMLKDYKSNLKTNISIKKKSYISYNDIKFFTPDSLNYTEKFQISGIIKGTYNNFTFSNLKIKHNDVIDLELDSDIKGIKVLKNSRFLINIKNFNVDFEKLANIKIPFTENLLKKIPEAVKQIGKVNYSGITNGKFAEFNSIGKISGKFGKIEIKTKGTKDSLSLINLNGKISASKIDVSQVFSDLGFGKSSFNQEFTLSISKNKKLNLKTFGKIDELIYKNRKYSNIDIYTVLSGKKIDSLSININQNEIKANFNGNIDFSSDIPIVKVICNVDKADLKYIGALKNNMNSKISFNATADFKGLNIDDFIGNIKLTSPFIITKNSLAFRMNKLSLKSILSKKTDSVKTITLQSDIADIKIITKDKTSEIISAFKVLFKNLLKSKNKIIPENIINKTAGFLDFEINIKQPEFLSNLFFPDYHISPNTKILGLYDPKKKYLNLSLNTGELKYKTLTIADFYFVAYTRNGKLYGGTGGSSFSPNKNLTLKNINIEGDLQEDTINFNLRWNNFKDSANYSADIIGFAEMKNNNKNTKLYNCKIDYSKIIMNDIPWNFKDAKIIIDSTKITIIDLIFKNNNQQIYIDGNISKYPGDILFAEFKNFEISNLQPVFPKDITLKGKLNGSTTFAHLYDDLLIFTNDSITDLKINDINFGNLYFKSKWDDSEGKIHANAYNLKGSRKQFMNDTIYGDYFPDTEKINFNIDIRSMSLKTFKNYYSEYVSFNPSSYISGLINITGNVKKPEFSGDLKVNQTSAYIKYLNTRYDFDIIKVSLNSKNIEIKKTFFSEKDGGKAFLKGNISHTNFSDFKLDVDLNTQNLKITDLNASEFASFYGIAYGSGNLNFSGLLNNIKLNADLKTEENTKIFIPISSNEKLDASRNYIRFVKDTTNNTKTKQNKEKYVADYSGFSMNLKLDITPDAEVQINPDESGKIITKGDGSLNLTLNTEGDFDIVGTYIITNGTYNLELVKLTKLFKIKEGSKIIFTGPPEDAQIDISAYYELNNVVLNGLYPNIERETIDKSNVICTVNLTETLIEPKLTLEIDLPENNDSEYAEKLYSFNEKETNEQFLALLLLKRFYDFENAEGISDATKPLGGDILAGQLNNVLEKFSKDINIIIDYNPGELNKSDEYGVQVAGKAFDNRIEYKVGGGYGGNEQTAKNNEKLVGEVEVEYKINKKGNFRGKFYNKSNDNLYDEGKYKQGAGFLLKWKSDYFFFWKHNNKGKLEKEPVPESK